MSRRFSALIMVACVGALAAPGGAAAQDPSAEVPDVAVSEAQPVSEAPSFGVAGNSDTPELWATVNICDTPSAPDSMGVRASMPGNGTDQRMYMRFSAQYWSRARQAWTDVAGSGFSPWVSAGSAEYERRQAGWTFAFAPPPAGVTFTMRAVVEFEWRDERPAAARRNPRRSRGARRRARAHFRLEKAAASRWRVVRDASRVTETDVRGVQGGDPAGTSKAMCLIY